MTRGTTISGLLRARQATNGALASLLLAAFLLLGSSVPRAEEPAPVDLQLILAVDVSGSVNQTRFELQKRGYVEAFRDARVLNAIRSGNAKSIAVTMVQWTRP